MIHIDIFLIIVFVTLIGQNYRSWSIFVKQHDIWSSPHLFCLIAMGVQLIGLSFDLWYYLYYFVTGYDNTLLYAFSNIILMISECTMIMLLFMIVNGWMTVWT